jgi:hypothetical protein
VPLEVALATLICKCVCVIKKGVSHRLLHIACVYI